MKEALVGLSEFRDDFVEWADKLEKGDVEAIVILRFNKPSGVMLSYDRYQSIKAQPSLIAVPSGKERELMEAQIRSDLAGVGVYPERERLDGEGES
jgi:PHD/YefM family antitoxin component YafN of YafNO toxin-antitoxin module